MTTTATTHHQCTTTPIFNADNTIDKKNILQSLHHRYNRSNENINDNLIITTPTTPTTQISPISPISPMLPTSPPPISPTSSSSSTIKPKPFTAFPANRKCRMMVSKIAGIIAIILVGGIVIYDLIKLALGSNEFDLSDNN
ncbi:unnamed protein product [Rhizophagus irregularis]|nr:unnamed protein product [Rhizophagus irregularis]CAB5108823.1 unnamed protein product [Rhizophagus irregularis]